MSCVRHRKAVSPLRFAIALQNSRPISCVFALKNLKADIGQSIWVYRCRVHFFWLDKAAASPWLNNIWASRQQRPARRKRRPALRGAVPEIRLSHVFFAFFRGCPMLNLPPSRLRLLRLCVENLMAGTGSLNCTSYFSPAWSVATFMGCNGTQKTQKGPANMNVHAGLEVCFGLA
jgi:hypothetical protein